MTNKLRQDATELRSQLEQERANREEVEAQLVDREKQIEELRSQLETERADREKIEAELAELKQKSAAARELPEAADLLNQLKAARKKSSVTLADMEAILEMIEKS